MALATDIIVAYILGFWFILLMGSAMCFGGPGATNDFKCIFKVLGTLTYPTWIFTVYLILGIDFFHFKALDALITSAVVIVVLFTLFGYTRLFFNAQRGINSEGYFIKANQVYYDGSLLKGADATTFQWENIIEGGEDKFNYHYYAKDHQHVYYRGIAIQGAYPASFRVLERATYNEYVDAQDHQSYFNHGEMLDSYSPQAIHT